MDDKFLEKYTNAKTQFHTVTSGRTYACVLGSVDDGLLLSITPRVFAMLQMKNNLAYQVGVTVRAIIKGKTYSKDFEWEKRAGENRLTIKEFPFAISLDDSRGHILQLLTESTFFKDLEKSLKFHGSTLNAQQLQELLLHTVVKLHEHDTITLKKFAFNF